ncbi:MAG: MASE3 domain-containing protein [Candidatus Sumerlaeia bacterium]
MQRRLVQLVGVFAVFAALLAIGYHNYLLFHCIVELFSIAVGCAIFIVAWNTRRLVDNDYLLFIGIGFLFVSGLDLLHTLGYRGMNLITNSADPATQIWIQKQCMLAVTLAAAPSFLTRRVRASFVIGIYGVVSALALATIFYWPVFPVCFADGQGLTPFKRASELTIVGLLGLAMYLTWNRRDRFDRSVLRLINAAILTTILTELSFMFYASPTGPVNMGGHFLQLVSFGMIYEAFVVTGLRRPLSVLFANLKRSRIELERKRDWLEARVAERTVELNRSIAELEERTAQLRTLAAQLIQAEQAERRRLSQVLHDHLQQMLVAARIHLGVVKGKVREEGRAALATVEELINESINESRSLSVELSPRVLYESGLPTALAWLGRQMEQKHGLKVEVEVDDAVLPPDENVSIMVFHSARELLFNIVKHAGVPEARLTLGREPEGWLRLGVEDRGIGYDPKSVRENFGLVSIRERMTYMGGAMEVQAAPGQGVRVVLYSPMAPPRRAGADPSRGGDLLA